MMTTSSHETASERPATAVARRASDAVRGRIDLEGLANLLPRDGIAALVEEYLGVAEADALLDALTGELAWEQRTVTMYGKTHPVPRLTAWCGEIAYTYSGITHPPAPWPAELAALRQRLEDDLGIAYNCVLGNLYRDGRDHLGWHADDEGLFGERPVIASISLGGERRFAMRHADDGSRVTVPLRHGSLLVMAGTMQAHWRHCVPATTREAAPRFNLTFRSAR